MSTVILASVNKFVFFYWLDLLHWEKIQWINNLLTSPDMNICKHVDGRYKLPIGLYKFEYNRKCVSIIIFFL